MTTARSQCSSRSATSGASVCAGLAANGGRRFRHGIASGGASANDRRRSRRRDEAPGEDRLRGGQVLLVIVRLVVRVRRAGSQREFRAVADLAWVEFASAPQLGGRRLVAEAVRGSGCGLLGEPRPHRGAVRRPAGQLFEEPDAPRRERRCGPRPARRSTASSESSTPPANARRAAGITASRPSVCVASTRGEPSSPRVASTSRCSAAWRGLKGASEIGERLEHRRGGGRDPSTRSMQAEQSPAAAGHPCRAPRRPGTPAGRPPRRQRRRSSLRAARAWPSRRAPPRRVARRDAARRRPAFGRLPMRLRAHDSASRSGSRRSAQPTQPSQDDRRRSTHRPVPRGSRAPADSADRRRRRACEGRRPASAPRRRWRRPRGLARAVSTSARTRRAAAVASSLRRPGRAVEIRARGTTRPATRRSRRSRAAALARRRRGHRRTPWPQAGARPADAWTWAASRSNRRLRAQRRRAPLRSRRTRGAPARWPRAGRGASAAPSPSAWSATHVQLSLRGKTNTSRGTPSAPVKDRGTARQATS